MSWCVMVCHGEVGPDEVVLRAEQQQQQQQQQQPPPLLLRGFEGTQ